MNGNRVFHERCFSLCAQSIFIGAIDVHEMVEIVVNLYEMEGVSKVGDDVGYDDEESFVVTGHGNGESNRCFQAARCGF